MKVAESKVTDANLTSIPSAIRKALKLEAGDYLEWHIENNTVKVTKKKEAEA